jgi:hypothetical protein
MHGRDQASAGGISPEKEERLTPDQPSFGDDQESKIVPRWLGAVRIVDARPARAMISALARRRASRCAGAFGSATGIGVTGFGSGGGGSGASFGEKRPDMAHPL